MRVKIGVFFLPNRFPSARFLSIQRTVRAPTHWLTYFRVTLLVSLPPHRKKGIDRGRDYSLPREFSLFPFLLSLCETSIHLGYKFRISEKGRSRDGGKSDFLVLEGSWNFLIVRSFSVSRFMFDKSTLSSDRHFWSVQIATTRERERERAKYKRMERERGNGNDATELDCTQSGGGERVANLHTFTLHWFCCSQPGYTLSLSPFFPDSNEVRLGVGTRYPFYFENHPFSSSAQPHRLNDHLCPVGNWPSTIGILFYERRCGVAETMGFPLPLIGKMEQIPYIQSSNRYL